MKQAGVPFRWSSAEIADNGLLDRVVVLELMRSKWALKPNFQGKNDKICCESHEKYKKKRTGKDDSTACGPNSCVNQSNPFKNENLIISGLVIVGVVDIILKKYQCSI